MKSIFAGSRKNSPHTPENAPFSQTNEQKRVSQNICAIKLYDFFDIFGIVGDQSMTGISQNLYIYKSSGKIKEGNEVLKGEPKEYSAFLGIMNVMGVNFLVLVKEVSVRFILDEKDKVFEIISLEFRELIDPQQQSKMSKDVQDFLNMIDKLFLSGGFYFSYKYPLTLSQQKIYDFKSQESSPRLSDSSQSIKLVDYDYMWNYQLMKPLIQQGVSHFWQVQLIQGNVFNFITHTPTITYHTLISRRQSRRGGIYQSHHGINSEGFVANYVETEQIIAIQSNNLILSHVQIRGCVPCFFTQRGISGKVNLDPSKILQEQACKLHLDYLNKNYNQTTLVNLMSTSKQNEIKLTKELKELLRSQKRDEILYLEFDFSSETKGDNFEAADHFIQTQLSDNLMKYGWFSRDYSGIVFKRQTGVIRTNCMDCLNKTNKFQMRISYNFLIYGIFTDLKLNLQFPTEEKFVKDFQICWYQNGAKISNHFIGTESSSSNSVHEKHGVLDYLKSKLSSAKKFLKGNLTNSNKQQCYCILLGEHYETQENLVFQEELQKELKLREDQFTKRSNITIFACTWNVGSFCPEKQTQKFPSLFGQNQKNHLVIFAFQEIVELKPKNIVMSTNSKLNVLKQWQEILQNNLGKDYFLVKSCNMVGIQTYIFARNELNGRISNIETDNIKCGFGGQLGNKGAVVIRFSVDDTSIGIVNCHLPAGQSKVNDRLNSLNQCINNSFQQDQSITYKREPLIKTDKIILMGDMNFRVDKKYNDIILTLTKILNLKKENKLKEAQKILDEEILNYDQLSSIINGIQLQISYSALANSSFQLTLEQSCSMNLTDSQQMLSFPMTSKSQLCLKPFYEKKIEFLPTYKFDINSDIYDTSKKQRVPSFCDRILIADIYNDNNFIQDQFISYQACTSLQNSDHKPVIGVLKFQVRKIDEEARDQIVESIAQMQEQEYNEQKQVLLKNEENDSTNQNLPKIFVKGPKKSLKGKLDEFFIYDTRIEEAKETKSEEDVILNRDMPSVTHTTPFFQSQKCVAHKLGVHIEIQEFLGAPLGDYDQFEFSCRNSSSKLINDGSLALSIAQNGSDKLSQSNQTSINYNNNQSKQQHGPQKNYSIQTKKIKTKERERERNQKKGDEIKKQKSISNEFIDIQLKKTNSTSMEKPHSNLFYFLNQNGSEKECKGQIIDSTCMESVSSTLTNVPQIPYDHTIYHYQKNSLINKNGNKQPYL